MYRSVHDETKSRIKDKVFTNLIVKAITSPFALLGSLLGIDAEELKSLEFDLSFLDELSKQGGTANDMSFVCLFGLCAQQWEIPYRLTAMGLSWSWLENQVAAATKLVPLGQTQAQQLLIKLQPILSEVINSAEYISEDEIGGGLPALAIASALHETQYSRLFRS